MKFFHVIIYTKIYLFSLPLLRVCCKLCNVFSCKARVLITESWGERQKSHLWIQRAWHCEIDECQVCLWRVRANCRPAVGVCRSPLTTAEESRTEFGARWLTDWLANSWHTHVYCAFKQVWTASIRVQPPLPPICYVFAEIATLYNMLCNKVLNFFLYRKPF